MRVLEYIYINYMKSNTKLDYLNYIINKFKMINVLNVSLDTKLNITIVKKFF